MENNEVRLEIVKAALSGGQILKPSDLDRMYNWVQTGVATSIENTNVENTKTMTAHEADNVSVTDGEFVTRMSSHFSKRVVTKCMIVFQNLGIKTIRDIRDMSQTRILHEKNTGKLTVEAISATMKTYGLIW